MLHVTLADVSDDPRFLSVEARNARCTCTVLRYDHDYDLIAGVTVQPTRWVVPPGNRRMTLEPVMRGSVVVDHSAGVSRMCPPAPDRMTDRACAYIAAARREY